MLNQEILLVKHEKLVQFNISAYVTSFLQICVQTGPPEARERRGREQLSTQLLISLKPLLPFINYFYVFFCCKKLHKCLFYTYFCHDNWKFLLSALSSIFLSDLNRHCAQVLSKIRTKSYPVINHGFYQFCWRQD